MQVKTRGIVINYLKYKDKSIIVRIYTEELGMQSYMVNGVRSAKAKTSIALFQPLTVLNLVVYHRKDRARINRIAEVKCGQAFKSIPFDYKKSGMALFLTEVLSKTLQEEEQNGRLFEFLWQSVLYLDDCGEAYENFHLNFLLQLSRYLGFCPESGRELADELEYGNAYFIPQAQRKEVEALYDLLLRRDYTQGRGVPASLRGELIDSLLAFYRLHVSNFGQLKSLGVLREMNR